MAKTKPSEDVNYCVYAHINRINRKVYVGITNNIARRWGKNGSGYLYGKCSCFKKAIVKYGWDGFEHMILEHNVTLKQARALERLYIIALDAKVPNGYNLTDGGEGVSGRALTQEHKRKLSEIRKRKIASGEIIQPFNGKAVLQFTVDGQFVCEYESASEAQRQCGFGQGTVSKACSGQLKTLGGYVWRRKTYGTH